jgi:hypothetical protein
MKPRIEPEELNGEFEHAGLAANYVRTESVAVIRKVWSERVAAASARARTIRLPGSQRSSSEAQCFSWMIWIHAPTSLLMRETENKRRVYVTETDYRARPDFSSTSSRISHRS